MSALLRTSPRILIPDRKRCRDYGVVWLSGGMRGGDKLHDISPRKQNGTLTNSPTWTRGKFGEPALTFNGSNTRVELPARVWPQSAFSFACWATLVSTSATYGLLIGYETTTLNYTQFFTFSSNLYARMHGVGTDVWIGRITTGGLSTGWQHYAFTWDGGTTASAIRVYINGVQADTTNDTSGSFAVSGDSLALWLGAQNFNSPPNSFLNGNMAVPLIGERAWSATQISNLYRNPFYLYRNPPSQFRIPWAGNATTVPGAPTLSMTVSSGTLHFTWTDGATGGTPITGYKLYVGTSSGGETLKYDDVTLTAGMSSFDDSVSISDGTTYWAYLTALNAVGESAASNEVSGTPPGSSPQTITITVASATASASAPTVTPGAATVTMPTASSTAAASSPTVTPGATTVTVTTCSATASASSPTITPTVTIASATTSATAAAISPTITAGTSTITVSTAQATASSSAPTITPTVTIVSPTASATASASAPTVTAGATTITVTTGTATAAAIDAGITNATLITPGDATATAAVSALLVIFGSTSIVVGTATGTAAVSSPTIAAGTTTISVGVVSATAGAVVVAVVSGNTAGTSTASVFYVLHGTDTHPIPLLGADPRPHEAAGTSNRFRELKG